LKLDRRTLLIGGGAGVGLIVAFALWPRGLHSELAVAPGEQTFGSFIKIARSGRVTVAVPQTETGQGIWTALPQIAADELGAAWESVAVEPAPLSSDYANKLAGEAGWLRAHRVDGGMRITAGATSVRAFARPVREAAAVARQMLVAAAAGRWNVDPSECETADGLVMNGARTLSFGELAEEAARLTPPRRPAFRGGKRARLVGRALQRLDAPAKSDGTMRFAGDVRLPEMLFASARLAPPGGRLTGFAREALEAQPGVRHVSATRQWIAVAADSWWQAEQALHAANPNFAGNGGSGDIRQRFEQALKGEATNWYARGDYEGIVEGRQPIAATYYVAPSQHLPLEASSASARLSDGGVEVWAATQAPGFARAAASSAAGVAAQSVRLFPMPVGSPSGSALEAPEIAIAIALAGSIKRPVQVTLPHHSAQNHLPLAPGAIARLSAVADAGGIPAAWAMRVATADGMGAALARSTGGKTSDLLELTALDGATPPYAIPNLSIDAARAELPFACGYMRGSPQREFAFFTESFVDELARSAGQEPLAFRMSMLGQSPRLARCFQTAAQLAQWDGGGAGSSMGIAGASAFGSHIALVATASIGDAQQVRVHKLVAAVDCGQVINAGLAAQQVEGALIWAIGQPSVPTPEFVAGMSRSRTLSRIALPRLGDTPEIIVHFVASNASPGGLNGLGAIALAPAVGNAIFAATGKRMRSLPFDPMAIA
jgi:isoquinoline 1-oxidoreductase beta subunit